MAPNASAKIIPWQMRQNTANLYSAVLGSNGFITVAWMTAYGDAPTSSNNLNSNNLNSNNLNGININNNNLKMSDLKMSDLKNSISDLNNKALPLVQAAFQEYPNLDEVDISIYALGKPPEHFKDNRPLMTL